MGAVSMPKPALASTSPSPPHLWGEHRHTWLTAVVQACLGGGLGPPRVGPREWDHGANWGLARAGPLLPPPKTPSGSHLWDIPDHFALAIFVLLLVNIVSRQLNIFYFISKGSVKILL